MKRAYAVHTTQTHLLIFIISFNSAFDYTQIKAVNETVWQIHILLNLDKWTE